MKQAAILLFGLALAATSAAQDDPREAFERQRQQMREQFNQQKQQARRQYDDARRKAEEEYAAFRKKANEEYAAAMQRAWQQMGVKPAEEKPKEPEPPKPPKPKPEQQPTIDRLPQATVVPPIVAPKPVPAPPIKMPEMELPTMDFTLYGTPCKVHTRDGDLTFKLSAIDEKTIAATWQTLSGERYDALLHDCLEQRDELRLSDWGYIQLLKEVSEKLQGKGSNEAVLLQMYLLTQSGYDVRIAKANDRLTLLVPFSHKIYGYSYTIIGDKDYYVLTREKLKSLNVCNLSFPREKIAEILMGELPKLMGKMSPTRTFAAERFGTMKADIATDKNLIAFLNDYPLSSAWNYYALAGLSEEVKSALYPALRSQIEGKSIKKQVTMLLDFVQTAFDYATDQDQFGYERPLFGDESFYYPKNDCEDRSILFSILVRDLMGLDVVLVHWPGHLATAVAFPEQVEGDYFTIDGRDYTVCDPTYIGAGVGMTMPNFKNVNAELVKLGR